MKYYVVWLGDMHSWGLSCSFSLLKKLLRFSDVDVVGNMKLFGIDEIF